MYTFRCNTTCSCGSTCADPGNFFQGRSKGYLNLPGGGGGLRNDFGNFTTT